MCDEYNFNKLYIVNLQKKYYLETDYFYNDPLVEKYFELLPKSVIFNRIQFEVPNNSDNKNITPIKCTISFGLEADRESDIYYIDSKPISEKVEWFKCHYDYYNREFDKDACVETTKYDSFDFNFTTNDSDIEIFEPHLESILNILKITLYDYHDHIAKGSALICTNKEKGIYNLNLNNIILKYIMDLKNISKNKKNKIKIDMITQKFKKNIDNIKSELGKYIISKIQPSPTLYGVKLNYIESRYSEPIAKTFANAIVTSMVNKHIKNHESKDCPHISKKTKPSSNM